MPGIKRIRSLNSLWILPQTKITAYRKFLAEFIAREQIEIASETAVRLRPVCIICYRTVPE